MPFLILGAGALAFGLGAKLAGNGLDSAGSGGLKMAGAVALAGGAYVLVKRAG